MNVSIVVLIQISWIIYVLQNMNFINDKQKLVLVYNIQNALRKYILCLSDFLLLETVLSKLSIEDKKLFRKFKISLES